MDIPMNADLEMIEALLQHMHQNPAAVGGGGGQMYEDIHDDDDDDDYDDDDEDDDEDDYYAAAGGEQHSINMFQNPYGGAAGGGGGGGEADAGAVSLLQGLLGMSGAGGMAEMGIPGMGGMGSPMDGGAGGGGGFDVNSFLPNMGANVGAALVGAFGAATSGLMDGLSGHGAGGATIHEYDDDEDDEEISEGSCSEDEEDDEEDDDEDDEGSEIADGVLNGAQMAAMAAMGGLGAGGSIAAMAAMMNQQQRQSPHQQMYGVAPQHPQMMPPHAAQQYMMQMPSHAAHQAMYSSAQMNGTMPTASVPQPTPQQQQQHQQQNTPSMMSTFTAAAAATAAAVMNLPQASPAPAVVASTSAASMLPPHSIPSAALSPPMSISSNLGGGTMSRVDPLAALALGGAAAAMGGAVMGKVVNTISNNSGGGTALVNSDHLNNPTVASMPQPMMHKSMDALNKLSDGMGKARISNMHMPPNSQAMQAAYSQQHLAQMQQHHQAGKGMMYSPQFMMPGMMIRPPMTNGSPMMPSHSAAALAAAAAAANGHRNDGDKTSLDRESVPCSETSGGGKSDTESTTKKTPSPTLVGPGRVSPDSSSGSSSSGSSDHGRVKNATSFASLSDLPSATESLRDSDTDQHVEQIQLLQRRLNEMDHDPLPTQNGSFTQGAVPLLIEVPSYGWSSLVGHENAKDALKNLFMGKKFPEVFDSQGSCRGVLLFGPSGAGKTSLARSLAYEAGGAKLIACTPSFILNRSLHPHAAATVIRQLFDHARIHKPCVMLMDEIEMLALPDLTEAGKWAKAELMAQVRGETTLKPGYPGGSNINDQVMLVSTTCSPWLLPEELRRLFAYNMHIKLPAEKQREELFRMFLNNYANNVTSDQYKCLLSKSEGYSAADIHTVTRQASYNPPTQQSVVNGNNQRHQNHPRVVTYDDLASVMTNYRCLYKQEHHAYYKKYIQEATHRTEDVREEDEKKGKPKGVKKFGRLAKSFAAAVISVID